jgi:hypothetical protein
MTDMSPEEFTELVRLSNSWSDLVRRCGLPLRGGDRNRRVSAMKKMVLSHKYKRAIVEQSDTDLIFLLPAIKLLGLKPHAPLLTRVSVFV